MGTPYTVVRGDSLSLIAKKKGFADWKILYQHESNTAFRRKRPDPSLICPGDVLNIPEPAKKTVAVATETTRTFQLKKGAASPAGNAFQQYMDHLIALEEAAVDAGYSLVQRVTAFRLLYYRNRPVRTYAGVAVGGGAWSLLIPGAANTRMPPTWDSDKALSASRKHLEGNQVVTVGGTPVDFGHLFAGLDAGNHPTAVELALGTVRMRSNKEAATYIGDLGSVAGEYIFKSTASFRDTAMERSPVLEQRYKEMHSLADLTGNADAYALPVNASRTCAQNLTNYYVAEDGQSKRRFRRFAQALGLGAPGPKGFAGADPVREALRQEVFNAALAYAASQGKKGEVALVLKDPGPGLFTPTHWEMCWNVSGWTVDVFLADLARRASAEPAA